MSKNKIGERYDYFAFISYTDENTDKAQWLKKKLTYYRFPKDIREGRKNLPLWIRPVFEWKTETSGGDLRGKDSQIEAAQYNSKYLIVICSPHATNSKPVNEEIKRHISWGREKYIIPFIIDGQPHAENPEEECFPPALLELEGNHERKGIFIDNINEDYAVVSVISTMFEIKVNDLWKPYERELRKKRNWIVAAVTLFVTVILCVTAYIWQTNINLTRANEAKSQAQSRAAAEVAIKINKDGDSYLARKVAVGALNISYTPQAEAALRQACQFNNAVLRGHESPVGIIEIDSMMNITSMSWEDIRVWDFYTGMCKSAKRHHYDSSEVYSFDTDFSSDSTYQAFPSGRDVVIANISNDEDERKFVGHTDNVNQTKYTPDNNYVVSSSDDRTVRIWDLDSTNYIKKIEGHSNQVNHVAYSQDGKIIVSASSDSTIRIWNGATGNCLRTLRGHAGYVNSVAFSPNGKNIVSASSDSTIRIWDYASGQCLRVLKDEDDPGFETAFFSPDGKNIVSSSMYNVVNIWDVATGESIRKLLGHHWGINYANYSPNGRYVVSASDDHTIRIWDANSWVCLRMLTDPECVSSISFSSDSKYLISSSHEGTIRIWHLSSGYHILTLYGHLDWVRYAAFSPDNKYIASASRDDNIHIWYFPPLDELINETLKRFKDVPLTPEERQKYYLE